MLSSYHWQITTHLCITMCCWLSAFSCGNLASITQPTTNQWWSWWRNSINMKPTRGPIRPNLQMFWLMILVSRLKFKDEKKKHFLQAGLLKAQLYELKILGSAIAIYFHQGFDTSSLFMRDVSRIRCTSWKHFGFQGSWWPLETTNCGWRNQCPQSLFGWYRLIKYLQLVGLYTRLFSSGDSRF